ncbi:unnamed protein product [Cyprideis torosa]|uniref:Coiled-coil protein 142 C-terminal domain-containing protein n=1 Tax=Cyprideis torosa TaxID=163714 RepID=A0A7R8ZUQ8_9CRUS|nr:unnamed protein product [Cyprideis torosa]CAG0906481.1 unnamed protein product [Cyprideis torosa]
MAAQVVSLRAALADWEALYKSSVVVLRDVVHFSKSRSSSSVRLADITDNWCPLLSRYCTLTKRMRELSVSMANGSFLGKSDGPFLRWQIQELWRLCVASYNSCILNLERTVSHFIAIIEQEFASGGVNFGFLAMVLQTLSESMNGLQGISQKFGSVNYVRDRASESTQFSLCVDWDSPVKRRQFLQHNNAPMIMHSLKNHSISRILNGVAHRRIGLVVEALGSVISTENKQSSSVRSKAMEDITLKFDGARLLSVMEKEATRLDAFLQSLNKEDFFKIPVTKKRIQKNGEVAVNEPIHSVVWRRYISLILTESCYHALEIMLWLGGTRAFYCPVAHLSIAEMMKCPRILEGLPRLVGKHQTAVSSQFKEASELGTETFLHSIKSLVSIFEFNLHLVEMDAFLVVAHSFHVMGKCTLIVNSTEPPDIFLHFQALFRSVTQGVALASKSEDVQLILLMVDYMICSLELLEKCLERNLFDSLANWEIQVYLDLSQIQLVSLLEMVRPTKFAPATKAVDPQQKQDSFLKQQQTEHLKFRISQFNAAITRLELMQHWSKVNFINEFESFCLRNYRDILPKGRYTTNLEPRNVHIASDYVESLLAIILGPMVEILSVFPAHVQLSLGPPIVQKAIRAWLDSLQSNKVKFSLLAAHQLQTDVHFVRTWLQRQAGLTAESKTEILNDDIFRESLGVSYLLMRQHDWLMGHRNQVSPSGLETDVVLSDIPAEMYVIGQEKWLALRESGISCFYLDARLPYLDDRRPYLDDRRPHLDALRLDLDARRPYLDDRRPCLNDRSPDLDARRPYLDDRRPYLDDRRPYLDDRRTFGISPSLLVTSPSFMHVCVSCPIFAVLCSPNVSN